MKSKIKLSPTKSLALGFALAGASLIHSAQAGTFSSTANGAYSANATWGGSSNPANGTEDSVTLNNNTVTISGVLTDAALDDIIFGSGNAGILAFGVGDVGATYSVGTFDFTTGNSILEVSHATTGGLNITDIIGTTSYKLGNGKTLTLQNGANFAANNSGSITINGTGTIAGAETINVVSPSQTGRPSLTFAGLFSDTLGGSSITKTGEGILALSGGGLYNYSGTTLITLGSLDLNGASAIANSAIVLGAADGTSTAMQGTYSGASLIEVRATASGTVTRGGSITVNPHGLNGNTVVSLDLTINGITGAANPVTEQFGALTLNTASGFYASSATSATLGNATLSFASLTRNAGTALVVAGGNLGSTAPGAATANSSNFILGNSTGITGSLVGGGGVLASTTTSVVPWLLANGGLGTYDAVNGVQALTTFGSLTTDMGTISQDNVRVSAATSLTGNTTVNSLTLNNAASAIDGANTLTVTSGAVNASANGASIGATTPGTLAFGAAEGNITVTGGNTLTIGSVITGSSGVNFIFNSNLGIIILSGANTFMGVTHTFANNTRANFDLRNSLALQNSTVDVENSTSFSFGDTTVAQTAYTFGGLTGVANLSLLNKATTPAAVALTIGSAGSTDTSSTVNTYKGVLSGALGSIIKTGPATQVFSGANTYTGTTKINQGTLQFAKVASLYNSATASWTAANINVASGATLALNVGGTGEFTAANVNTLLGNISVTGSATTGLQAGAIVGFDTSNAGGTFAPVNAIADSTGPNGGAIGLTKLGTGTLLLTNAVNTYTGLTKLSAGTLALSGSGSIANTANIVVASNATLDVSGLSSAFTLAATLSSQTLSNSMPGAIINGTNNCSAGTISLVYDGVNPSFTITNGGMTVSSSTTIKVNNTGTALGAGSFKLIAKATAGNVGLVAGTVPSVTLGGNGKAAGTGTPVLRINGNNELYLDVPPAALTLGNNGPICAGDTLNLTANTVSGGTYAWTGPNGFTVSSQNPSIANATMAASGTYHCTVTVNGVTSADATTAATVNALPTTTAGNSGPVCVGTPLSLTSSGGVGYAWSGPNGFRSTAQNPTVNVSATLAMAGVYTVIATNASGCTAATTTTVTVNALPTTAGITGTNSVQELTSATYSVANTAGSTYGWTVPPGASFTGGTGNSINVTFGTTSGNVSVIETNASGCTGAAQSQYVTVIICTSPSIMGGISASATNLCAGSPVILTLTNATGTGPLAYQWETNGTIILNATNASYTNSAVSDTWTYSCVVTNGCGSVTSSVVTVTVHPTPSTSGISGTTTVIHATTHGYSVSATGGSSYGWTVPAGATFTGGTSNSISVTFGTTGGNVTVVETNASGCMGTPQSLAVTVAANHLPVAAVMTVKRTAGLALLIALSDVATNWTDSDSDHVSLTGVTMQTTNSINLVALNWATNLDGSIVTTNAYAFIGYTNSPNVADQISYGISDGQGGTNLGYINIVIQSSVTGTNSITAYNFSNPASNTITAYGIPNFYYILERATNLTAPAWVDVQTNQANATNGVIKVADTFWDLGGVKPNPSAFYQLKWQP